MDAAGLTVYCVAKPGAVPDTPWEGVLVAKVSGKIFAFLGGEGVGLKCGRNALDGTVPDDELRELVDASYDAVVAKLPRRLRPAPP